MSKVFETEGTLFLSRSILLGIVLSSLSNPPPLLLVNHPEIPS